MLSLITILMCFIERHCSSVRVLILGGEGQKSAQGQKYYVCCALGQGTLLSFAPFHLGELNGYRPTLGKTGSLCSVLATHSQQYKII